MWGSEVRGNPVGVLFLSGNPTIWGSILGSLLPVNHMLGWFEIPFHTGNLWPSMIWPRPMDLQLPEQLRRPLQKNSAFLVAHCCFQHRFLLANSWQAWMEHRGMGFIAPSDGTQDLFVHRSYLMDGGQISECRNHAKGCSRTLCCCDGVGVVVVGEEVVVELAGLTRAVVLDSRPPEGLTGDGGSAHASRDNSRNTTAA